MTVNTLFSVHGDVDKGFGMVNSMLYNFSINDVSSSNSNGVVARACLDYPRAYQIVGDKVVFAGWVITAKESSDVSIVVVNGSKRFEILPDIVRKDVLKAVLNVDEKLLDGHKKLKCGFSAEITIDPKSEIELFFSSDAKDYAWKVVSAKKPEYGIDDLKAMWRTALKSKLSTQEMNFIKKVSSSSVLSFLDNVVLENLKVISQRSIADELKEQDLPRGQDFFQYVLDAEFPLHAVESAITHDKIIVPNPFSYGFATCSDSYNYFNNTNMLKFVSSGGEVFFIFQHVGSVDAVYFPERQLVTLGEHLSLEVIKAVVVEMLAAPSIFFDRKSGDNKFQAIIASHNRPYHFYYDVAPVVSELNSANLLSKIGGIYYYEGGCFCSFKDIYDLEVGEETLGSAAIMNKQLFKRGFSFSVGFRFDSTRVGVATRFDRALLAYAYKHYDYTADEDLEALRRCYPVIWFGVTVQKRSWIEQVDAAKNIFNELHKIYPNLGIVFDGWTSPLVLTESDRRETSNDLAICDEIMNSLPSSIKSYSVIGYPSHKKVVYGRLVDAYIGNSATGGLHIARFSNKPGVGHLNTQLIDSGMHIRNRTILVDKTLIKDAEEDINLRVDFISYSIDWRVIYNGINDVLSGKA